MILGMSLATFTKLHVIISLIGIVSGIVVMFRLLGSRRTPGWTALFLLTTILTSATGFLFPFTQLLPSHIIAIISLVLLAIACVALYGMKLAGAWRWIYVVTAMVSLYLNIFVLIIQGFLKVPALHALAPSVPPSEPPFAVAQGLVLLFFILVDHRRGEAIPAAAGIGLIEHESHPVRRNRNGRAGCPARMPARSRLSRACLRSGAARPASKMPSCAKSCTAISWISPRSNPGLPDSMPASSVSASARSA